MNKDNIISSGLESPVSIAQHCNFRQHFSNGPDRFFWISFSQWIQWTDTLLDIMDSTQRTQMDSRIMDFTPGPSCRLDPAARSCTFSIRNSGVGFTALQFYLIVVQPHTLNYQMDTTCLTMDSTRIFYGHTGHFDPLEPFCRLCFSLLLPTSATPFIRSHLTWSSPNTDGTQQLIHLARHSLV
jgi:hypothetical protein